MNIFLSETVRENFSLNRENFKFFSRDKHLYIRKGLIFFDTIARSMYILRNAEQNCVPVRAIRRLRATEGLRNNKDFANLMFQFVSSIRERAISSSLLSDDDASSTRA